MEVLALLANPDLTPALERLLARPDDDAHQPVIAARRQKQRRLAADAIGDLLVRYSEGTSVQVLAEQFGVHRTTVMEHLERNGVPRRECVRQLTDQQVTEAADHYSAGESLVTVAARYKVSPRTIAREFDRAGMPTRTRNGTA